MNRSFALLLCLGAAACGSSGPGAAAGSADANGLAAEVRAPAAPVIDDAAANERVVTEAAPTAGNAAAAGEQSNAQINANATAALGETLVKAHATLDGRAVSGIKPVSTCEAKIEAGGTSTPFRWGEQGNLAARLDGKRQTLRLPAEGADAHVLAFDQGNDGDGVVAGLGLLVMNCGG